MGTAVVATRCVGSVPGGLNLLSAHSVNIAAALLLAEAKDCLARSPRSSLIGSHRTESKFGLDRPHAARHSLAHRLAHHLPPHDGSAGIVDHCAPYAFEANYLDSVAAIQTGYSVAHQCSPLNCFSAKASERTASSDSCVPGAETPRPGRAGFGERSAGRGLPVQAYAGSLDYIPITAVALWRIGGMGAARLA